MSELIAAADRSVTPDYHMFGIEDRGSAGESGTPTPGGNWLGVGETGVLISVGEDLVSPGLRLEVWDGPPSEVSPDYEAQETIQLFLPTGNLAVNEITGGWSDGLPQVAAGRYHVRITGWDCEKTRLDYAALGDDWDTPEFEEAAEALAGQERYLIQLWLETPTATLINSIGLKIHDGYPLVALADSDSAYTAPLEVVFPMADPTTRPGLHLQVWDGPPPFTDGQLQELHVPSGAVTVMHLKSAGADRHERVGGSISRFFRLPPGNYHVLMTAEPPTRYVARFWPR